MSASAAVTIDPDDSSMAVTEPASNVTHFLSRGGVSDSDSTIRGGTENLVALLRGDESSISSNQSLPGLDSRASSSVTDDDDGTISTVNSDSDASSIDDMLWDDAEFNALRMNSVLVSRVPEEVIAIADLEEQSLDGESLAKDNEIVDDEPYKNIQKLMISKIATDPNLGFHCLRSAFGWRIAGVDYERQNSSMGIHLVYRQATLQGETHLCRRKETNHT